MDQDVRREAAAPDPAAGAAPERVTPMMAQYGEIKVANPDCLLFYRMGDFYELFFEDAETASRALGIALTKRGKHLGADIPMCGVPVHAADDYLQRLIALGHRVAVCEQTEDPAEAKKRGGKSVVRRGVVRLVTPGTLTEDALLDARRANHLLAVARVKTGSEAADFRLGLAWVDISTGAFEVAECDAARLPAEIARIEPAEIVLTDALHDDPALGRIWRALKGVTIAGRDVFDGATAARRLAEYFQVATIDAFGPLSRPELIAAAAIVTYVDRTQFGQRPPLAIPARVEAGGAMRIDAATRANLELIRTLSGERSGSLLSAVDRTVTAAGGRLLAERLAGPLTDIAEIRRRHASVDLFRAGRRLRENVRAHLAAAPDMMRALTRIALGRAGPRDLAAIRDAIAASARIAALDGWGGSGEHQAALEALGGLDPALHDALAAALADELPYLKRDGGFVRPGADAALDEARKLRDESRQVIAGLQSRYAEATEVKSLKVRHNNVLGYYIEVSQAHGERFLGAPFSQTFVHRQTMAGAMRFTTTELGALEAKIASAGERALGLELEIFERLAAAVVAAAEPIRRAARGLAVLDVAAGLAALAEERDYVRPEIDDSLDFAIRGGRHPVVEQALSRDAGPFIGNDCDLSGDQAGGGRIWLLTGPNMAGKSTFLRQNALIALLAQAGSHVPATWAKIGVVDALFSRVGAADDLARGRSTFMVEMVETAAILNQAGRRALVILDEIGRGTATFDGLSIAWASVEHLHDANRCRALFATHFHELTALSARLPRLVNATMRVKEWQGEVIFLHEVVPGSADRSYGIQVARLAGLPPRVIDRAREVLAELEDAERAAPRRAIFEDLPLFAAAERAAPAAPKADRLREALAGLDPDAMSPREALEALYALKGEA